MRTISISHYLVYLISIDKIENNSFEFALLKTKGPKIYSQLLCIQLRYKNKQKAKLQNIFIKNWEWLQNRAIMQL